MNIFEGITIENVESQFGLHKMIKELTYVFDNSSSCIALVSPSQPKIVVDSGTQPSLLPNCHHQIIYAKFNLKILYPLPYTWKIWHYEDSNDDFSN